MSAHPALIVFLFCLRRHGPVRVALAGRAIFPNWRNGDWAGGRFGTVITWFLMGGDLYRITTTSRCWRAGCSGRAAGFSAIPYATFDVRCRS